jgi:single-strand DNA-binding protein
VEGRLQTRSGDDRNTGEKRYKTEVVCENFQMLGQRGGDFEPHGAGGGYGASSSHSSGGGPSYEEGGYGGEPEEDDIPF